MASSSTPLTHHHLTPLTHLHITPEGVSVLEALGGPLPPSPDHNLLTALGAREAPTPLLGEPPATKLAAQFLLASFIDKGRWGISQNPEPGAGSEEDKLATRYKEAVATDPCLASAPNYQELKALLLAKNLFTIKPSWYSLETIFEWKTRKEAEKERSTRPSK